MKNEKFNVTGMTCAACQANVSKTVSKLNGIKSVDVNLLSGSMKVEYDENIIKESEIIDAVQGIGYGASTSVPTSKRNTFKDEWNTNPYIAEEKDGEIYGRGSCDMKGGIAICLEAILNSLNKDFMKDKLIIFAGTADEETGENSQIGAKLVANYLKENNIKAVGVILPEPNNHYEIIKVNIGHRGAMWVA